MPQLKWIAFGAIAFGVGYYFGVKATYKDVSDLIDKLCENYGIKDSGNHTRIEVPQYWIGPQFDDPNGWRETLTDNLNSVHKDQ